MLHFLFLLSGEPLLSSEPLVLVVEAVWGLGALSVAGGGGRWDLWVRSVC